MSESYSRLLALNESMHEALPEVLLLCPFSSLVCFDFNINNVSYYKVFEAGEGWQLFRRAYDSCCTCGGGLLENGDSINKQSLECSSADLNVKIESGRRPLKEDEKGNVGSRDAPEMLRRMYSNGVQRIYLHYVCSAIRARRIMVILSEWPRCKNSLIQETNVKGERITRGSRRRNGGREHAAESSHVGVRDWDVATGSTMSNLSAESAYTLLSVTIISLLRSSFSY